MAKYKNKPCIVVYHDIPHTLYLFLAEQPLRFRIMQDVLGKYNLIETLAKETNSSLHNIQDAHSYFALDLGIFFNFYLAGRDDTF